MVGFKRLLTGPSPRPVLANVTRGDVRGGSPPGSSGRTIWKMKARQARRVLDVAKKAIDRLRTERPMGDDWIITWSGAVILLRVVGHALKNVDRAASRQMARAVDDAWTRWETDRSAHSVFWLFIRDARNAILKEFELKAGQGVRIQPGASHEVIYHVYIPEFEHLNQLQLLDLAVRWWETELDIIERTAGEGQSRTGEVS